MLFQQNIHLIWGHLDVLEIEFSEFDDGLFESATTIVGSCVIERNDHFTFDMKMSIYKSKMIVQEFCSPNVVYVIDLTADLRQQRIQLNWLFPNQTWKCNFPMYTSIQYTYPFQLWKS